MDPQSVPTNQSVLYPIFAYLEYHVVTRAWVVCYCLDLPTALKFHVCWREFYRLQRARSWQQRNLHANWRKLAQNARKFRVALSFHFGAQGSGLYISIKEHTQSKSRKTCTDPHGFSSLLNQPYSRDIHHVRSIQVHSISRLTPIIFLYILTPC